MKNILTTMLLIIISTIFVGNLFSIYIMENNPSMMLDCPIIALNGNGECPFNNSRDIQAILEHVSIISHSTLAIFDNGLTTLSLVFAALSFSILYYLCRKLSLLIFVEKNYRQFHYHQNKAWFSITPSFLLVWLAQKIRGEISASNNRVYMTL